MQPWTHIQRAAIDGWAADPLGYAPPGGESVGELQRRVNGFFDEIAAQGIERAVLVTHAGVMKVLVGRVRALPAREWMALSFDYEGVVRIALD
jgi:alpha-ribazole phosphatase